MAAYYVDLMVENNREERKLNYERFAVNRA